MEYQTAKEWTHYVQSKMKCLLLLHIWYTRDVPKIKKLCCFHLHLLIFDPFIRPVTLGLDTLFRRSIHICMETFFILLNRDTHHILINCRLKSISWFVFLEFFWKKSGENWVGDTSYHFVATTFVIFLQVFNNNIL